MTKEEVDRTYIYQNLFFDLNEFGEAHLKIHTETFEYFFTRNFHFKVCLLTRIFHTHASPEDRTFRF